MSVDKAYVIAQMGELHKNRDDADFTLTSSNGEVIKQIKAHSYILSLRWVNWPLVSFKARLPQV